MGTRSTTTHTKQQHTACCTVLRAVRCLLCIVVLCVVLCCVLCVLFARKKKEKRRDTRRETREKKKQKKQRECDTLSRHTFRARSQRRVNLAKKLSLFKLKEDALEQVFYKRERARKQAARKRSEALATLAAAFSGPHYSLAPGQDVTAFRLALTALGVVKGSGDPLSDLSIVRVFEQLMATGHDITLKRVLQALDVELSPVTAKQLNEEIRRKKLGMYDIYHDICKNNENSNHNDNHK